MRALTVLLALVLLPGCGSAGVDQSGAAPAATKASEPRPLTASEAAQIASAAVLAVDELPGYTGASGLRDENYDDAQEVLTDCLGLPSASQRVLSSAEGGSFESNDGQAQFLYRVNVVTDAARAETDIAFWRRPVAASCHRDSVEEYFNLARVTVAALPPLSVSTPPRAASVAGQAALVSGTDKEGTHVARYETFVIAVGAVEFEVNLISEGDHRSRKETVCWRRSRGRPRTHSASDTTSASRSGVTQEASAAEARRCRRGRRLPGVSRSTRRSRRRSTYASVSVCGAARSRPPEQCLSG